jgi:hypothetical protein
MDSQAGSKMTREEHTIPSRWKKLAFVLLLGIVWLVFLTADVAVAQCPMCKTALEKSAEGQQMASAFNDGILFLLSAPFLVVGAIALMLYRKRRDWQRHREQSGCDVSI